MIGTKIVATVGPASESPEILESLIRAGVNVFRFNLKHNTPEWHSTVMRRLCDISDRIGIPVAVLADIPGREFLDLWVPRVTEAPVDYVALSYIRHIDDVRALKDELSNRNSAIQIIGKIETNEALAYVEEIIHEAHGIMVARGDLGVALPIEEVPYYQKRVIKRCLELGKPVITATEMLESMIENEAPTRAEVSDVANAMYDWTDAVMLSAETAIGKHPVEAVEVMRKVAAFTDDKRPVPKLTYEVKSQTDALTMAANDLARQRVIEEQRIKAFVVITTTGQTAKSLARLRPTVPIIAVTPDARVRDQLVLVWGVSTILFTPAEGEREVRIGHLRETLLSSGVVAEKDHVILIYGAEVGVAGNTNVLRIETM
jgi:pyruvate kinase